MIGTKMGATMDPNETSRPSLTRRMSHMNRGVFFLMVVSFFFLTCILFGIVSAVIIGVFLDGSHYADDYLMMALFIPAGVGAAFAVIVATIAASFYKPVPPAETTDESQLTSKPPVGRF